jgi:hypothetical protein
MKGGGEKEGETGGSVWDNLPVWMKAAPSGPATLQTPCLLSFIPPFCFPIRGETQFYFFFLPHCFYECARRRKAVTHHSGVQLHPPRTQHDPCTSTCSTSYLVCFSTVQRLGAIALHFMNTAIEPQAPSCAHKLIVAAVCTSHPVSSITWTWTLPKPPPRTMQPLLGCVIAVPDWLKT